MNITSLKYFVLVAEELSFTKAARKLYISQQALSKTISNLEQHYDAILFNRSIPLSLTESGEVLYQSAKKIINNFDECDRRLQEIKDFTIGKLSIGVTVTRGTVLLPEILPRFSELYPNIKLSIFEGLTTFDVYQALAGSAIDLSIAHLPHTSEDIISEPLYKESYMLVVPNTLLFEKYTKQEVDDMLIHPPSIKAFYDFPFIAQEDSTIGGQYFLDLCTESGFAPKILYTVQNILTELNLCISGAGACTIASTFLPMLTEYEYYNHPYIHLQSVTCFRLCTEIESAPLTINYPKGKVLTEASQAFIRLAKEYFLGKHRFS